MKTKFTQASHRYSAVPLFEGSQVVPSRLSSEREKC